MVKKQEARFQGISNKALGEILMATILNAATLQEAGIALPEFKTPKMDKSEVPKPNMFTISNGAMSAYLSASLEIAQKASDLRKAQYQSKEPKFDL